MSISKLLVDSVIFFSLINIQDANHQKSRYLNNKFIKQGVRFLAINLVIFETATVLSHKISQQIAINYLKNITSGKMEIIRLDEEVEKAAFNIFQLLLRNKTSYVDCANMAVMKKMGLTTIFSFDKIYKINNFKRAGID